MSQHSDRKGEDWRDMSSELEGRAVTCLGCGNMVDQGTVDEDGLCPDCEAEDDELEEMGEEPESDDEATAVLADRLSEIDREEYELERMRDARYGFDEYADLEDYDGLDSDGDLGAIK